MKDRCNGERLATKRGSVSLKKAVASSRLSSAALNRCGRRRPRRITPSPEMLQVPYPVDVPIGAEDPAPAVDIDQHRGRGAGEAAIPSRNGQERRAAHRDAQPKLPADEWIREADELGSVLHLGRRMPGWRTEGRRPASG